MEQSETYTAEFEVSDMSQLGLLQGLLTLSVPDGSIARAAGQPGAGEQGALDTLVLAATGGGLVAAIRVLPEFLRSRRTALSVKMTVKGKSFQLTVTNVDEVMPILEKLLDD